MRRWSWIGERSALVTFDGRLEDANADALWFAHAIQGEPGVEDAVCGARSTLVVFDRPGDVWPAPPQTATGPTSGGTLHEIPVVYDGEDLPSLAAAMGRTTADVARAHAGPVYRVGFIGFAPGFPYLFGLPPELHAQRRATPRPRVAAGSVAIGGTYTGIYPAAMPGGWHLVGTTSVALFDPERGSRLRPGDRVRFVPA